jgi:type IV pilus assembly protein PilN
MNIDDQISEYNVQESSEKPGMLIETSWAREDNKTINKLKGSIVSVLSYQLITAENLLRVTRDAIIRNKQQHTNLEILPQKQEVAVITKQPDLKSKATKIIHTISEGTKNFFNNLGQENLLGVDITPNCIYVCKIDGKNGKRVLTSLTSVCMEGKFMTEDIKNYPDEYADSLKTLLKDNNIKSKNVALSIPVSNSTVKTITLPSMQDAEIKQALQEGDLWQNLMGNDKNYEDYSVFYQIVRGSKYSETMDLMFVATKLSDVCLYTDIVKQSGLNPVIVDIRCFAINNAYSHRYKNDNATRVFIEFGCEENYALIVDGAKAHVFNIDINDNERTALTETIVNETLIDSFVLNYATQVSHIISEYEDRYNKEAIKDIIVLSSTPFTNIIIDKLTYLLENHTITHCNCFDCMNIKDDFTVSAQSARQTLSAWATCIGNSLRKVDIFGTAAKPKYNTNFLKNAGEYENTKRLQYIANGICAIAAMSLIYFITITQITLQSDSLELSIQLAELQSVEDSYNQKLAQYDNLKLATGVTGEIDDITKNIGSNQHSLLAVHQYLASVLVEDVWLKEMTFTAPNQVEIIGASTSDKAIVKFISLLNEGKQFQSVALKSMQESHEMSFGDEYASTVKNFIIHGIIADSAPMDFNK